MPCTEEGCCPGVALIEGGSVTDRKAQEGNCHGAGRVAERQRPLVQMIQLGGARPPLTPSDMKQ